MELGGREDIELLTYEAFSVLTNLVEVEIYVHSGAKGCNAVVD